METIDKSTTLSSPTHQCLTICILLLKKQEKKLPLFISPKLLFERIMLFCFHLFLENEQLVHKPNISHLLNIIGLLYFKPNYSLMLRVEMLLSVLLWLMKFIIVSQKGLSRGRILDDWSGMWKWHEHGRSDCVNTHLLLLTHKVIFNADSLWKSAVASDWETLTTVSQYWQQWEGKWTEDLVFFTPEKKRWNSLAFMCCRECKSAANLNPAAC